MVTQLVCDVPDLVPSYSMCQLNIPGLECYPPSVYCQQVGIFEEGDHIGLSSLKEGIDGPLGPI